MKTSDSRLPLLDYCRFLAALAVVSFHYFWNGIQNGKISSLDHVDALTSWARYGYLGVDLFFMISGYVIFMSARRRTASQFIVGRAVRLYPAYLVAMLVTAAFAACIGTGETAVSLKQVLGNVLLYKPLHHQRFVDGVYWTLMIEVTFYAAVAVLIAIGTQKHFNKLFQVWPLLMLGAFLLGHGDWMDPQRGNWPLLGGYYAFFASGAIFAILSERATAWGYASLALSTALAARYALALMLPGATPVEVVVTACLLASFTLVFVVINWSSGGRVATLPAAGFLGALTYPLYLVHAHIGYMLLSRFGSIEYRATAYVLTFGFVLLLAWIIHELVEVRWAPFWRSFFEGVVGGVRWPASYVARRRSAWRERPDGPA